MIRRGHTEEEKGYIFIIEGVEMLLHFIIANLSPVFHY